MKIKLLTLFPDMCRRVLEESIIGRAAASGILHFECINIRDYTLSKQKRVDDAPYGGGMGVVMQADPIGRTIDAAFKDESEKPHLIYMSPQGATLTQERAKDLSKLDTVVILCGHYEGIDERILDEYQPEELSIGDYVLTGGELPALVLIDTVCRLVPGVLSEEECFTEESHYNGLLEYPQYTRPAEWRGREIPEILLSGHHANIEKWRAEQSLERTQKKRPDLLSK